MLGVIFQAPPQLCTADDYKLPATADFRASQEKALENGSSEAPADKNVLGLYVNQSNKVCLVPFAPTMQADGPNGAIHFDYLYCGPSKQGDTYVLILKDNFSAYVWLIACKEANAAETVDALFKWFTAFGIAPIWISDRGSHFKNEVMQNLGKKLRVDHQFTPAYSPHTNGTVENVCKPILRAISALLPDLGLQEDDWPLVIPLIQSLLNNSKSKRLGSKTPLFA